MKKVAIYAIIGASALVVGASAGIIYKRCILDPQVKVEGFDADYCRVDGNTLIKKVENTIGIKNAANQLRPYEIVNYAFEKYKRCENCYSFGYGHALASIVDQKIHNLQIKNGSTYFEESVAQSDIVGVALRMQQEEKGDNVTTYKIKSKGDAIMYDAPSNYIKTPNIMTIDDYASKFGRDLKTMFNYIIHDITVLSEKIEEIDGGYKINLELDPITGGFNYKYQMYNISGIDKPTLEEIPTFKSIKLEYELDSNLIIKRAHVNEIYDSLKVIHVDTNNLLDYEYHYDEYLKIPSLNEYCDLFPREGE